jgi:hypothetical protein
MIGFRLCLEAWCLGIFDPVYAHRRGGVFLCLNRSRAKTNGAQSTRKWTQLWAELKPPVWRLRAGSLLHTQQITNSVIAQEVGRHPSSYVKAAAAVCSRSRGAVRAVTRGLFCYQYKRPQPGYRLGPLARSFQCWPRGRASTPGKSPN